jgi:ACR3 family arsenite transporter
MSVQCETTGKKAAGAPMGLFERYLTVWVFLCIGAGILLGQLTPGIFHTIGALEVAHVNLPVALLIWLMILPMLLKIDLKEIKGVRQHWRGVGVTLFVNWAVKPFSMALLAWLFVGGLPHPAQRWCSSGATSCVANRTSPSPRWRSTT